MTESGVRKKLARQGYRLRKGKDCYGCPGYIIIDINNAIVTDEHFSMSLEDVEKWAEE